jgi:hypothetical protein
MIIAQARNAKDLAIGLCSMLYSLSKGRECDAKNESFFLSGSHFTSRGA